MSKSVPFLDGKLVIYKLTVDQVDEIRQLLSDKTEGESQDYAVVHTVLKYGADNGENLTVEDLKQLPLEELSKLSEAILEFSGVKDKEKKS
jgi:DNA-binding transcriptional MerR regulator